MKTIKDAFTTFKQSLASIYTPQETEAITLMVLTEITNTSKASIKAFPERELLISQQEQADNILSQLKIGKPLQYILGYTEFYGLKFLVNPAVLIPRPETEELVQWTLDSVGSGQLAVGNLRVLDIGTGSGCIAISLKNNLPDAEVSAIDISPDALQTAMGNAKLNKVDIDFIQDDILNTQLTSNHTQLTTHNSPLTTHHSPLTTHYSLIISNPPYVTLDDKKQMHTNVTDFEPHTALFVPEDDPLIFYKAIAGFAIKNLQPNGLLFFEINESYGPATVELLENKGFKNIELRKDMSDRYRMIKATR